VPRIPNPYAVRVSPEHAYEVWQSYNGAITYWVLKKYQAPEREAANPNACWYVWTKSPATSENGEYGDAIAAAVKRNCRQIDNPLCNYLCICLATLKTLQLIGLKQYRAIALENQERLLSLYTRIAVPKHNREKIERLLEDFDIRIVCVDNADYIVQCLADVQSSGQDN
jgi:hypothetical protein